MDTGYPALIPEPDIPKEKKKEKDKTENPLDEDLSDQDSKTSSND